MLGNCHVVTFFPDDGAENFVSCDRVGNAFMYVLVLAYVPILHSMYIYHEYTLHIVPRMYLVHYYDSVCKWVLEIEVFRCKPL